MMIFDVFSGCFLEGFWSGVGAILGDFLDEIEDQTEKGRLVEMLVLRK